MGFKELEALARKQVDELLSKYIEKTGYLHVPILLQTLASIQDKHVEKIAMTESPRGRLRKQGKKWVIEVPYHFSKVRRRVEVAHELAHTIFLDDAISDGLFVSSSAENQAEYDRELERVCDLAARLILIPEKTLPKLDDLIISSSISKFLIETARRFQVTVPCVAQRLFNDVDYFKRELGIVEVIIWNIRRHGQNNSPRATPHWKLGTHFIPIGRGNAKKNSVTDDAINLHSCSRIEKVSIGELEGEFAVDAFAYWKGDYGFRRVLTTFRDPGRIQSPLFDDVDIHDSLDTG